MPERSVDPVPVVASVISRPDSKVAQSLRRWHAVISISMVEAIGCEFIAMIQAEKLPSHPHAAIAQWQQRQLHHRVGRCRERSGQRQHAGKGAARNEDEDAGDDSAVSSLDNSTDIAEGKSGASKSLDDFTTMTWK
jgi:hypothetical protein